MEYYYVSLGMDCAMAGLLQDNHIRSFSSPFDWLDGGTLKTRTELIKNGFQNFFNLEDFTPIFYENDPQRDKRRFHNIRTQLCFHHDWMIDESLEKYFHNLFHEKKKTIFIHRYIYKLMCHTTKRLERIQKFPNLDRSFEEDCKKACIKSLIQKNRKD